MQRHENPMSGTRKLSSFVNKSHSAKQIVYYMMVFTKGLKTLHCLSFENLLDCFRIEKK